MIIFPDKFHVGFQKRSLDGKTNDKGGHYHMGYLVTDTSSKSWNGWRDTKIAPMEIINTPRSEYRIFGRTQRSRDWFGSGRSMVYIEHPDGFVFEITVDNLIGIHAHMDTVEGEFKGNLILAKDGKNLLLIPENSDEYKIVLSNTKAKNSKAISSKTILPGTKYLNKNNEECVYLGKYLIYTSRHKNINSYIHTSNNYAFETYTLVHNLKKHSVIAESSLKAISIIKEKFIDVNECDRLAKTLSNYVEPGSKFVFEIKPDTNKTTYYYKISSALDEAISYESYTRYGYNYNNNIISDIIKNFSSGHVEVSLQKPDGSLKRI